MNNNSNQPSSSPQAATLSMSLVGLLALITSLASPSSVFAASSSWLEVDGANIRLVSLPSADGKTIQAGLQIDLHKGWKTYWRSPGASGLPPQISFSGSRNTASTKIDFPVPVTFGDAQNLTAGYKKPVIFPIDVKPLFANQPVTLNVSGTLGICGTVCVPVPFQLTLNEDGKGVSTPDIASAILSSRSNLLQNAREDFKVETVRVKNRQIPELHITAKVPADTKESALFIEGPEDWYLTPAKAETIDKGQAKFRIVLKDIPKDANPAQTALRLSLVANGRGITQEMTPQN